MYLEETADYLFPVFVAHILIEFVNLQPSDYSIPTLYLRKSVCENPEVLEFEGILGEKAFRNTLEILFRFYLLLNYA